MYTKSMPTPSKDDIAKLTEMERHVTQEQGTEAPFSGAYWNHHEDGMYHCVVCGKDLFSSSDKFDSGTGWPSFTTPIAKNAVATKDDSSHGMRLRSLGRRS